MTIEEQIENNKSEMEEVFYRMCFVQVRGSILNKQKDKCDRFIKFCQTGRYV